MRREVSSDSSEVSGLSIPDFLTVNPATADQTIKETAD